MRSPSPKALATRPAVKRLDLADLENLGPARTGPTNPDAEMGAQLTEQYLRATGGMVEVLKFGAMMLQLEAGFSGPHADHKAGRGQGSRGGMREWMRVHAPQVTHSTAMRLKAVTISIGEQYAEIVGAKVAKQYALPALVTTPADQLPAPIAAKQMELFDFVRGTSQRSWLDQFAKNPSKARGGDTSQRAKKLTPEEEQAALEQAIRDDCTEVGRLLDILGKTGKWRILKDAEIEGLRDLCSGLAGTLTKWVETPRSKRSAVPALSALI